MMNDNHISYANLNNLRENMQMKAFAKEVLTEENDIKFMKSFQFTFWFQLLGVVGGFLFPSIILLVLTKEIAYIVFGMTFGMIWMCLWILISVMIPQTRIYRRFAKWFRKKHASLEELDEIFYLC